MRVLGLDVGERRIGVAVSDALGLTAQQVTVLERRQAASDVEAVCALATQHGATQLVVGLPLTLQGERGPQAQRVMAFGDLLRRASGLPVEWIDERFTTAQGEDALTAVGTSRRRRKQVIDQVAAQLILQAYLDAKRPRP